MFLSYLQTAFPQHYSLLGFKRPDILEIPIDIVILESLVTFVANEVTGNSSHVDRVWTFLPPLYTAYFTFLPLFSWAPDDIKLAGVSNRCLLMLGLQLLWSFRLSYNTWRRGLFKLSEEDYRWQLLRDRLPGVLYTIFSFVFIAFIQHFLLFAQGLPAYAALLQPRTGLTSSDISLALLALTALVIEFTADNQQWTYQNFKRGNRIANSWPFADCHWTELDAKRGFVAEGLWSISRHPNFLCEQAFWCLTAFYPILGGPYPRPRAASPISYFPTISKQFPFFEEPATPWWPIASAFAYCVLFLVSTNFSEGLTSAKYPAYAFYQERVGMYNPVTTFLKGVWLGCTGRKSTVEAIIWKSGTEGVRRSKHE